MQPEQLLQQPEQAERRFRRRKNTMQPMTHTSSRAMTIQSYPFILNHQHHDLIHNKRDDPRDAALCNNDAQCLQRRAHFAADGGDSGHARRVQQGEQQEAHSRIGGKQAAERCREARCRRTQQDAHGADNSFLGAQAGNQRSGDAPVFKTQRTEDRGDPAPNHSQ